jgi:streptogramin lyase
MTNPGLPTSVIGTTRLALAGVAVLIVVACAASVVPASPLAPSSGAPSARGVSPAASGPAAGSAVVPSPAGPGSQTTSPSPRSTAESWTPCQTVTTEAGTPPDPGGVEPMGNVTALKVIREIEVAGDPVALAFGARSLWVVSMEKGTLSRVDPEAGRVTGSLELGTALGFGWVAATDDAVWLVRMGDNSLSRLDPSTLNATTVSLDSVADRPYTLAVGHDAVWVSNQTANSVTRVDPESLEVVETIDVRPPAAGGADFGPAGVAVDDEAVWVSDHRADALTRIDPDTNAVVATTCLGSPDPGRIAVGEGAVWVADIGGVLNRVSPATMEVEARVGPLYGPAVGTLAIGDHSIWVANASHVVRVDPSKNVVDGALLLSGEEPVDDWPGGLAIAYGSGSAWVTHPTRNVVVEVAAP